MERDLDKDLIEIECAIKSQKEKDNTFTMSVLQRCHKLVSELKGYRKLEEQGKLLKLPCAVGDTVYEVQAIRKRIPSMFIAPIAFSLSNPASISLERERTALLLICAIRFYLPLSCSFCFSCCFGSYTAPFCSIRSANSQIWYK